MSNIIDITFEVVFLISYTLITGFITALLLSGMLYWFRKNRLVQEVVDRVEKNNRKFRVTLIASDGHNSASWLMDNFRDAKQWYLELRDHYGSYRVRIERYKISDKLKGQDKTEDGIRSYFLEEFLGDI